MCCNCNQSMTPYFVKKTFHIVRCPGCRLMAVANVPEDLSPFYSEGYFTGDTTLDGYMDYDHDKEVTTKTYQHFLDSIGSFLAADTHKTMFEVGCATGFFMKLAEDVGWKAEGIDISDYAVKKAVSRGLVASTATLELYRPSQHFGAVVMQDVIEHVKDPVDMVRRAANLIEQNGLLAVTTPDASSLWARVWGKHWHAFVPPQHLFYFTGKNLTSILEKNGFKVVYLAHHGKWFTLPYIVRLLYSWTGLKVFSKLAEWTARSVFRNVALPINLRDTIYLIARKV